MSSRSTCPHDPMADGRYRRLARYARCLLHGDPLVRIVHQPDVFAFRTPAAGDAFEFTVNVYFMWCLEGADSVKRLVAYSERLRTEVEEDLLRRLRPMSRQFAPYEPDKAEAEIGTALTALLASTTFSFQGRTVRTIPGRILVQPADEVRQIQQEAWKRRQAMDNTNDLAKLLKDQLAERRELWARFLSEGIDKSLTRYAVSLAEDPERAAEVVKEMEDDQLERLKETTNTFIEQTKKYEQEDLFDTMISYETVLRGLAEAAGIELPAPKRPFGEPPEEDPGR